MQMPPCWHGSWRSQASVTLLRNPFLDGRSFGVENDYLKTDLTSCERQRVRKTWKKSFRTNFPTSRYSRVWLSPWERRCDHMASHRTSRREVAASPVALAARLADPCTRDCARIHEIGARRWRLAAPAGRVWSCTSWACRPRRYPSWWRTFRTGTLCPSTLCFVTLRQQSVMYVRRYAEPENSKRKLGEAWGSACICYGTNLCDFPWQLWLERRLH